MNAEPVASNGRTDIDTRADADAGRAAAWVDAFTEGWRAPASPEAFVAHFRELLAPAVVLRQPQIPPTTGLPAFERDFVRPLFALVDGIHAHVERWAAAGDAIFIELTLRGRIGGRPFSTRVCDRVRLRPDGRASERETYLDPTTLLGAVARSPRAWPLFLSLRVPARVRSRRLAPLLERIAR